MLIKALDWAMFPQGPRSLLRTSVIKRYIKRYVKSPVIGYPSK